MAFVVVGDIDPDAMEKMIHDHFDNYSDLLITPLTEHVFRFLINPAHRPWLLQIRKHPYTLIQVICKTDPLIQVYQRRFPYRSDYQLITSMLNQRLEELKEQANPPLLYSAVQFGSLVGNT